jgi:hypothetical protein
MRPKAEEWLIRNWARCNKVDTPDGWGRMKRMLGAISGYEATEEGRRELTFIAALAWVRKCSRM